MITRHDNWPVSRPLLLAALTGAIVCGAASRSEAQFQNTQQRQQGQQPQIATTKGKVEEVIRKGRATSLVIQSEAGGDPITVPITPRIQFAVEVKGDNGFLAEKQVVSGKGTLTNGLLFVKNFTVHVGLAAKKIRPTVSKADKVIGESQNTYQFAGTIVSRQQDKDYPDYETLTMNIRQLKGAPVYMDKGANVTVSMTETDRVQAGDEVEFVQRPAPGGRFQIVALRVLLKEPLKSEEFFAEDKSKTSSRRRRSS